MRVNGDVFIAGTGVWLASTAQLLEEVVTAGLVGADHSDLGYVSVLVDEEGVAAPDMAIAAGRKAVQRSGVDTDDFGLHLHAGLWFQGVDYWSAANYVARHTISPHAVPFQLDQRSCSGLGALHLATAYLQAGASTAALITTGDRYAAPYIDRFNSQTQTIYGDGGAALVLSTRGGFARILSSASVTDSRLEGYSRGTDPFAELPGSEIPVKIHKRYEQWASATDSSETDWSNWGAALLGARDRALDEAGLGIPDIKRLVTPFVHRGGGQTEVHDALGFTEAHTLWREFGRHVGHLGAGDQIAGLNYLVEHDELEPGDHIMLLAVGMGFNFSAAVLEITERPAH